MIRIIVSAIWGILLSNTYHVNDKGSLSINIILLLIFSIFLFILLVWDGFFDEY